MHLDSPDSWRIVWVVAAGSFTVAEMARRLRLWFLPFAVGAAVAAATAWAGLSVALEWVVFVAVSAAALAGLRPVARRLMSNTYLPGAGSGRWVGREAHVEVTIPARGDAGWVRLGRERWRALSGMGTDIPAGSTVLVTGVDGTRLTVLPLELSEISPPTTGREPDQGD